MVPAATVTVKQMQTGETRSGVTNDSGAYIISTVPAGTYDVSISKAGFKIFDASDVTVLINTTVRVDDPFTVGPRPNCQRFGTGRRAADRSP